MVCLPAQRTAETAFLGDIRDSSAIGGFKLDIDWNALFDAAREARENAYAPYSTFQVGAALLTDTGEIVRGCNVENRSYGLCICAERTAVSSAVASGFRKFRAVAVVTDTSPPASPCGMCRETLTELCDGDTPILMANLDGEREIKPLRALFPDPFQWPENIPKGDG